MIRIFISYTSVDEEFADKLAADLRSYASDIFGSSEEFVGRSSEIAEIKWKSRSSPSVLLQLELENPYP